MKLVIRNGFYTGMRDTGCSQNYLGLKISCEDKQELKFREYIPIEGRKKQLDIEILKKEVLDAVAQFNVEYSSNVYINEIKYVPSDAPNYSAYKIITHEILLKYFN